jgi:glyoxylate reductase
MPNRKKPLVVVTRKLPDSVETRMRELFDARLNIDDKPLSPAGLVEAIKSADVLVPTVTGSTRICSATPASGSS